MITSRDRSRLAALAQGLPDLVQLGKDGASPGLVARLARLLSEHELVKLRFLGPKADSLHADSPHADSLHADSSKADGSKADGSNVGREELARALAADTDSEVVRVIGNTAVFWRRNPDPEKRRIEL
jgi:RNA-binding protein